MDDIARAAGVVRRTVYGHFPSREALIAGIADEAAREVTEALDHGAASAASPVEALVGSMMATWEIGDRYRLLIALARRDLTGAGIRDHLRPARERLAGLLSEGARTGSSPATCRRPCSPTAWSRCSSGSCRRSTTGCGGAASRRATRRAPA